MSFLLNNHGVIWTRSFKEDGSKTEEQLRYGKPDEATHAITVGTSRFWVAYADPSASEEEVKAAYLASASA